MVARVIAGLLVSGRRPPRDLSAAAEAAKQEDFTDEDSEELESEEEDEEYDQASISHIWQSPSWSKLMLTTNRSKYKPCSGSVGSHEITRPTL